MELLSIEEQMEVEGGFVITAGMIASLITVGVAAPGIYKLLTSKKGRIKLPFIEFEWALKNGDLDRLVEMI